MRINLQGKNSQLARQATAIYQKALHDGTIVKGPCEVCGSTKVHGHHDDYAKPIEVRWLCSRHHNLAHKWEIPKELSEYIRVTLALPKILAIVEHRAARDIRVQAIEEYMNNHPCGVRLLSRPPIQIPKDTSECAKSSTAKSTAE